ncbi:MAG: hypothetical protein WCC14_14305 [Acidobacteriaceae bacterium]
MSARSLDSTFRFPNLTSLPRDADLRTLPDREPPFSDRPLGAFRGLAFALALECAIALVGFSSWHLWHLLR